MNKNKIITLFSILIFFTVFIYIFLYEEFSNCITLIDHFYFSVSTLTFVGYGDIVPISQKARLITNIFMILIFYIVFMT